MKTIVAFAYPVLLLLPRAVAFALTVTRTLMPPGIVTRPPDAQTVVLKDTGAVCPAARREIVPPGAVHPTDGSVCG